MLALICGSGDLPRAVAEAAPHPPIVCALRGFVPAGLEVEITFRLETLGSLFAMLKARGVTQVCLCGTIRRPQIDPTAIDAATMPLVPRFQQALAQGDDGALRVVLDLFSDAGFDVLAAHHAAPALLPSQGVLTRTAVPPQVDDDLALAEDTLARIGAADTGQACVLRSGAVIAQEGPDGTDAMLAGLPRPGAAPDPEDGDPFTWVMDRTGDLLGDVADWLSGIEAGPEGFLYKGPKPQQDRRVDLPVIGPGTAQGVIDAGLAGIVIEAGGVMVLDRDRTVQMLDRAGRFLWVRARGT